MEITFYTPATIRDFVSTERFSLLRRIPVTPQRAVSHSGNPRATENDRILFVAWENNEVAGYLGVLPDFVYESNSAVRVAWLSCFWIDPAFRGNNLSTRLLSLVMEAWEDHILITNMAPGTIGFYLRTGLFNPPVFKEGYRGYLRFNLSEILPPKKKIFRKSGILLKGIDWMLNLANGIRLLFYPGYGYSGRFRMELSEEITPEAAAFISDHNKSEYSRRGKEELDWILRYPWIREEDAEGGPEKRYYFSSTARRFIRQTVEIHTGDGILCGFLLLTIRDNHLTVPCFYGTEEIRKDVTKFLFNILLDYQLNMLTVFHESLMNVLRESTSPFIFHKKILRPYVFPKSLDIMTPSFQDGDGDSIFT